MIAESFDGRRVDDPLLELEREGDGVLGSHRFTGRGVRRHQHRLKAKRNPFNLLSSRGLIFGSWKVPIEETYR